MPNEYWFDHEKLEVYREAISFVAWLSTLLDGSGRIGEVKDQLDRASTSTVASHRLILPILILLILFLILLF